MNIVLHVIWVQQITLSRFAWRVPNQASSSTKQNNRSIAVSSEPIQRDKADKVA